MNGSKGNVAVYKGLFLEFPSDHLNITIYTFLSITSAILSLLYLVLR